MKAIDDLVETTERILKVVGDLNPENRHFNAMVVTLITQKDYDACIKMAKLYINYDDLFISTPHPQYGPLMHGAVAPVTIDFHIKFGVLVLQSNIKIVKDYENTSDSVIAM